ncbi:hypothetical protein Glove_140g29 [Diversispora epigaea]|uniref:Protein kinase domain-containing protein n=1 Tax=Diversispora epigaea TaxID=1348612 RepID=A0A397J433_9GLOM|nr:hypothetical protein Glove_140g29 [Diversispora epigaea]
MFQEKRNEYEATREWETWMDNLIIEDTFQKENIPFYQYSEFENVKLLSRNVFKATFKISQKTVALKSIILNNTLDSLINEIKRHRKLEIHDSILKFYGITKKENTTNNYMIILEYANEGSLYQYLKTNFQKLDWKAKLNLAKQIADILMYLHSGDIIHGKLNSENILVHNRNIKLNDFGMAKCMPESLRFLTNTFGPIQYIDPQYLEIFHSIGKNKSSDIFSLGIILWEISSGNTPFGMESSLGVDSLNDIIKGKREMAIPGTNSKYKEIYTDCWKHDGKSRPDISQVVKNLSEIIISDESFENETPRSQAYNVTDEIIYVKSENSKMQIEEFEIKSDPPFVDILAEDDTFIENLFEFFIDLFKKQSTKMQPIMIKDYIRKHKKNPVEILYQMISHPSNNFFTSLIGFFYMCGIGTVSDYQMAFKFFDLASNKIIHRKNTSSNLPLRKLYDNNKEIGFIYLADMHLNGLGVEKNANKAFNIYSNVANEGSFIALTFTANCYRYGFGVEKTGKKAFELFLKSAEEGHHLVAQHSVGVCHINGIGTAKNATKGFQWLMKSALSGNIGAISIIGYCYNNGIGVGKDEKEAFKWYLKAAEKGDSVAQHSLGNYYTNWDQVKAFEWFKKAAENDYSNSQYIVGKYFYEGCGTVKDAVKSIYWLNKAKENGNTSANELLEEIINKIFNS